MRKLGVICFYSTHLLDLYQGFELCIFKNVASCELHLGLNGVTDESLLCRVCSVGAFRRSFNADIRQILWLAFWLIVQTPVFGVNKQLCSRLPRAGRPWRRQLRAEPGASGGIFTQS